HVDSHHHVHLQDPFALLFRELVAPIGVPLRGDGRLASIGGFYAQWEWGVTELRYVSVEFLQQLLRDEVGTGWTELSCHPGYVDPRSEEHTSELQSRRDLVCRLLLEKKKRRDDPTTSSAPARRTIAQLRA